MNNVIDESIIPPWHQQRWCWFVLTPLIVVIVMCTFTVSLAFTHQDDIVVDNYYQEGRMINQRFDQEAHAQAMGLHGELHFDRVVGEVQLTLKANEALPDTLVLSVDHPALEEKDIQLQLTQIAAGHYRGDLPERIDGHWYIRVQPSVEQTIAAAPWRIKAEIDFNHSESVRFNLNE